MFLMVFMLIEYLSPLPPVLLKLPVSIVQWTYLSCLQPARDTVEMEGVLRSESILRIRMVGYQ